MGMYLQEQALVPPEKSSVRSFLTLQ